ncbi:glycine-rich domain-containing protein [Kitasatospora sp. NPDC058965]|uniref:glycine-rich domain-containing protein n=1 Tax=Kitasatospora sp. NPDC058965 TaxID=3346682 RepID=UPI0036BCC23F
MTMAPSGPLPTGVTRPLDARELLKADDYECVVATVLDNNPGMGRELAERIIREALKFVATAAINRNSRIAPSRVVDEGWHALILHTKLYEGLCASLGGFVHHFPERPDPSRFNGAVVQFTTSLMADTGFPADPRLWGDPRTGVIVVAASCTHSPPDCQVTCMNKPG